MVLIRRSLFLLAALLFVYGWYFLSHTPKPQQQNILGIQSGVQLFIQPNDGKQPILSALEKATKTIDVEVYLLSDKDIINNLVDACQRGVAVRVLLEEHPFGGGKINQKTKQQFDTSCVRAQWTNSSFALTHEKTIVIDNSLVLILNQNLTTSSFSKNREYDIEDANLADVAEVERIFTADWNRTNFQPTNTNLLVSPVSSRNTLESLARSSTRSLDIEMEVIDDPEIVSLLSEIAKTSQVHVILPSLAKVPSNKIAAIKLQEAGISVRFLESPYLHAKLLIMDEQKAYIGSVNFTTQSMDSNREVGIIVSQQDILQALQQSFDMDWGNASAQ